jgi:hypothetical protein
LSLFSESHSPENSSFTIQNHFTLTLSLNFERCKVCIKKWETVERWVDVNAATLPCHTFIVTWMSLSRPFPQVLWAYMWLEQIWQCRQFAHALSFIGIAIDGLRAFSVRSACATKWSLFGRSRQWSREELIFNHVQVRNGLKHDWGKKLQSAKQPLHRTVVDWGITSSTKIRAWLKDNDFKQISKTSSTHQEIAIVFNRVEENAFDSIRQSLVFNRRTDE